MSQASLDLTNWENPSLGFEIISMQTVDIILPIDPNLKHKYFDIQH